MAQGLVATTFEAGPDDSLLVVDVYESSGSAVSSSYQKKDGGAIDVLSAIGGGEGGGEGTTTPVPTPAPAPPKPSQTEVNRILSGGSSDLFGLLTNLSAEVAAKFGIDSQTAGAITTIVNGVAAALNTSYSASDVKNVADIVNVLSDGAYTSSVKDKKALDSLVTATVTTGAEIGLPGVFSQIASNEEHDKEVLANVANQAIQATIENGDASVFLDVTNTEYATGLQTRYPSVIQDVLSNTTKPSTLSEQGFSDYYTQLTDSFDKVNVDWNKTYRDNEQTLAFDAETVNEFLNETLEAYVLSVPLDIKHNSDVAFNSAVDVQFGDVQIGSIFRAIYGATLDNTFISEKIAEWVEPEAAMLRQKRKDAWLTMAAKQLTARTIEEDFQHHFPLEVPSLTREIAVT